MWLQLLCTKLLYYATISFFQVEFRDISSNGRTASNNALLIHKNTGPFPLHIISRKLTAERTDHCRIYLIAAMYVPVESIWPTMIHQTSKLVQRDNFLNAFRPALFRMETCRQFSKLRWELLYCIHLFWKSGGHLSSFLHIGKPRAFRSSKFSTNITVITQHFCRIFITAAPGRTRKFPFISIFASAQIILISSDSERMQTYLSCMKAITRLGQHTYAKSADQIENLFRCGTLVFLLLACCNAECKSSCVTASFWSKRRDFRLDFWSKSSCVGLFDKKPTST